MKVIAEKASLDPIVLFDSGIGALSLFPHLREVLPFHPIHLFCDHAFHPYGKKSELELIERIVACGKVICRDFKPSLIVVACNTASTTALEALRRELKVPIVGVVPAVKPAALSSKTGVIGLLATPYTASSSYVKELVKKYADDRQVVCVGSAFLVEAAEKKVCGSSVDLKRMNHELIQFSRNEDLDCIVLGCTHFPLLLEELHTCLPKVKTWVDSTHAVARRVVSLTDGSKTHKEYSKEDDTDNMYTTSKDHSSWLDYKKAAKQFGLRHVLEPISV